MLFALAALTGCVKTPELPAPPQQIRIRLEAREGRPDPEGRFCTWEEESLWYGYTRLIGDDPPEGEAWCIELSDHWRTLDELGRNGPFLSLEEASGGCCPGSLSRQIATWNVEQGQRISVLDYDERHGEKRLARARRLVAAGLIDGVSDPAAVDPARFYIRDGHVVFVLTGDDGRPVELPVP
jgi:hypothetical protein